MMIPRSIQMWTLLMLLSFFIPDNGRVIAQDPQGITSIDQPEVRRLPQDIWLNPITDDFSEIQKEAETYFRAYGTENGYQHWKRWEYLMERRLTPEGHLTNYVARNFEAHREYESKLHLQRETNRTFGGVWEQEGSDGIILGTSGYMPGMGRVNVIAFHPTNSSIIFAGTPAGGLWKTSNEGVSWQPLTDGIPSLGVSGIAVHPTDPDIIYILTGDGDGGNTTSIGVLKTTDGGLTWQTTDEFGLNRGYKLAMKPDDPNTLFAVTNQGIYRTINGGQEWVIVQFGEMRDLEFRPGTPDTIYACTETSFYRSFNGGANWNYISNGLPSGSQRIALAVTPADPNYVYALTGPGGPQGTFNGLYRSTDSGSNFELVFNAPNVLDGSVDGMSFCQGNSCGQAWYDLAIAVDPDDRDEVIIGGINVWRNEDIEEGDPWQIISHYNVFTQESNNLEYIHADIHELVYHHNNNNHVWCGSDGGIFLSINDGIDWTDKTSAGLDDGLMSLQYYRIAGTPQNASLIIGGTQDNGTNLWTGGNDITHILGADGMECMIDPTNSDVMYYTKQRGQLFYSINGGDSYVEITPSLSNGDWVTPIRMDPGHNLEIWAGYQDTLYRSLDGGSNWAPIIPSPNAGYYKHIYCPPSNNLVIYAATNTAIFRNSNNGNGAWTNITGNLPVNIAVITGITTDVTASGKVWVTFGGYQDGEHVFYTSTGANPWTDVSGSLPDIPVNCIVYDDSEVNDNAVYVGTDIGIFYRDAGLNDWVPFRNGLPNALISDMYVHEAGNRIFAGTFGRGLWSSELYTECPQGWNLTNANQGGTYPEGYKYYQSSGYITSIAEATGGIGSQVFYKAGDSIELNVGFRAHHLEAFRAWLGPCVGGPPVIPFSGEPPSSDVSLFNEPENEEHGTDIFILQEEGNGEISSNAGNMHLLLSDDQSSLFISTGKEEPGVEITLWHNGSLLQVIKQQIHLVTGINSIPLQLDSLSPGVYQLIITKGTERIEVPLEIPERKVED